MFFIIINKQETQLQQNTQSQQLEDQYVGRTVIVPYYRWWYNRMFIDYNWWPYYYGSNSSNYYSTYRYKKHRHHKKHKHSKKHSITIIADKTGKTHVASKNSVIPVTVSGKRDNIRLASMRTRSISVKIPNKSVSNNKVLLLAKSKTQKK